MRYELKKLEALVGRLTSGEEAEDTLALILEEKDRLPQAIASGIYHLPEQYHIRQHICLHQDRLVKLADKLYHKTRTDRRLIVAKALVSVLHILEELVAAFPEHTNNQLALPLAILHREQAVFAAYADDLKKQLRELSLHPLLVELTLRPLTDLVSARKFTYHAYHYLLFYREQLQSLNLQREPEKAAFRLVERLLVINYNHVLLFEYCTAGIRRLMDKANVRKGKEKVLTSARKAMNQLVAVTGVAYDERYPAAIPAVLKWTEEELAGLDNLSPSFFETMKQPFRVLKKLNISVAVLAYMTRLCIKHGIYPPQSETEILQHMVDTYCSRDTDQMSPKSFYNCYNSPTDATARALRKILRAMLADIDALLSGDTATGRTA